MASGKGTLIVGQSGGPTAVINASLAGILGEARRRTQIERVLGMVNGIEGALNETLCDLSGESGASLRALARTPGSALGSCRRKLGPGDHARLFQVFAAHNVRYFLYAGGNDSMDTCHRVKQAARQRGYDLSVIGVPKTIDNDLAATDHCPGFGTAARFIAQTTRDTGLDLMSLRTFVQVMLTEIMGRNSGWLAASSILGKECEQDAPHLVYVPERAFDEDSFLHDVECVYKEIGFVAVAVSEGVREAGGELVGSRAPAPADAFGHKVVALGRGVGPYLADLVTARLGLTARCNRPGTIQRVSSAHLSAVDVAEAEAVGRAAVEQVISGDDGYMITLVRTPGPEYASATGLAPLQEVANAEKRLPPEYLASDGVGISPTFRDYALPLLGEPLPAVARLGGQLVPRRT